MQPCQIKIPDQTANTIYTKSTNKIYHINEKEKDVKASKAKKKSINIYEKMNNDRKMTYTSTHMHSM